MFFIYYPLVGWVMTYKVFDSIVKKFGKMRHKIVSMDKLEQVLSACTDLSTSDQKIYKLLYTLKNRWYLITLKKNLFFIKDSDETVSPDRILERHYRDQLRKHCKDYVQGHRYIGGLKALEFHMSAYDIPEDDILVVNEEKQATEIVLFDRKVVYKVYTHKHSSLYPVFKKFTTTVRLPHGSLPIAWLELALLETLYNPSSSSVWYVHGLIKKVLKKHKKTLNVAVFAKLLQANKHHTSINRLHSIAMELDQGLADQLWNLIKKYSYFIS